MGLYRFWNKENLGDVDWKIYEGFISWKPLIFFENQIKTIFKTCQKQVFDYLVGQGGLFIWTSGSW